MIIISDLHTKNKEPFQSAILKFLDYLIDNYKNNVFVFLGDVFDTASPHNTLENEVIKRLIKLQYSYILVGNHDQSMRLGNTLLHLDNHKNIEIINTDKIIEIENMECLFLPYQYNMDYYSDIKFKGDLCFTHFMLRECAFGNEFIDIPFIKSQIIAGHIHTKNKYPNIIIPGVPIPTRNLETNNNILRINPDSSIEEIEIPEFFKIETIDYNVGVNSLNKEYLYNIINCPDKKSVENKFKEYFIRWEGIELKKENSNSIVKFDFESNNLLKYFNEFSNEKQIKNENKEICLQYLS